MNEHPAPPSPPDLPTQAKNPFLLVMQFFLIPLGVVAACVSVFVFFGLLASDEKTPEGYLHEITGSDFNRRWQAAFELSKVVARDPEAARAPAFVKQLAGVFENEKDAADPRVRRYLALTLGRIGSRDAVPSLVRALADADAETVLYAAWALGATGDASPDCTSGLAGALGHADTGVRKMAAYALGSLGDAPVPMTDALAACLHDEAEDVRWNAAIALAQLRDDRGVETLHRMLQRDYLDRVPGMTEAQKTDARVNALRALAALRHAPSLPLARELASGDADLAVRNAAMEAEKVIAGE